MSRRFASTRMFEESADRGRIGPTFRAPRVETGQDDVDQQQPPSASPAHRPVAREGTDARGESMQEQVAHRVARWALNAVRRTLRVIYFGVRVWTGVV